MRGEEGGPSLSLCHQRLFERSSRAGAQLRGENTSRFQPGQLRPEHFLQPEGAPGPVPAACMPSLWAGPPGVNQAALSPRLWGRPTSWPPTLPAPTLPQLPGSCQALARPLGKCTSRSSSLTPSHPKCGSVVTCHTQLDLSPPECSLCPFPPALPCPLSQEVALRSRELAHVPHLGAEGRAGGLGWGQTTWSELESCKQTPS